MTETQTARSASINGQRRNLMAGAIGNAIEFYDFIIYAFLAQYFARHFFPSHDPVTALIATYGGFAAGMLMRPVGGVIIGAIADRIGRKAALQLSVLMIAVPTFLIGLLPTYESIGLWAPVLLVLLRLMQGLSLGGEYPAAVVFLVERAPSRSRGLAGSFSPLGVVLGLMLGSAVCLLVIEQIPAPAMQEWGWRVPFIASLILTLIGALLRNKIAPDSPRLSSQRPAGLTDTLRDHWRPMVAIGVANAVAGVTGFVGFMYAVPWMIGKVGVSSEVAYGVNFVSLILCCLATIAGGRLGDQIGWRRTTIIGAAIALVGAWPAFALFKTGIVPIMMIGSLLLALAQGLFTGPFCASMASLLPREVRTMAMALGYSTSMGIFGGLSPMVTEILVGKLHFIMGPALVIMGSAILSLLALLFMPSWQHTNGSFPEDTPRGVNQIFR